MAVAVERAVRVYARQGEVVGVNGDGTVRVRLEKGRMEKVALVVTVPMREVA